jgi:hypothetical protein
LWQMLRGQLWQLLRARAVATAERPIVTAAKGPNSDDSCLFGSKTFITL